MKRFVLFTLFILCLTDSFAQPITVSGVSVTGRFNTCSGNNIPVVSANLISTGGGSSVVGGFFNCINTCDSSTIRVTISNVKWNKNPNAEWLHGLFLPANAGFSVSPVAIPFGFMTYNAGCVGMCVSGSGTNGGPGFYFDNTAGNTCCAGITANDGIPCNNYGDVTVGCNASLSLTFDITFCNSLITSSSYQFVFTGSSDGETGCYNYNDGLPHHVTFTMPTIPCPPSNLNLMASDPVRTCVGNIVNYTSTLSGTCNANSIHWWDAATGGNLLGVGSPFTYDPAGSACPAGTTLYATCCMNVSTVCVNRTPVTIPGICDLLAISGVTSTNTVCNVLASINSVNVLNAQGAVTYTLTPGGVTNSSGVFTGLNQTDYTITASDGGGCTASTSVSLAQVPQILFLTPVISNVTCSNPTGGQLSISASGGVGAISFSISPLATQSPAGTFTGLSAQSYTIIATDAANCSTATIVTLSPPPIPVWSSFSKVNLTCASFNNGSISATASGGTGIMNYSLLPIGTINTSGVFNGLTSQTYTVIATDGYGCSISSIAIITNPPPLNWSPIVTNATTCSYLNNGSLYILSIGGTPPTLYQLLPLGITNNTGIFAALAAGVYTVKATDANNCTITTAITILQAPPIILPTPTTVSPLCNGGLGSMSATASGGTGTLTFSLSPGGITNLTGAFPNITAGTYTVTVTDNNSCTKTTVVNLLQPPLITFPVAGFNSPTCNGNSNGSITVSAAGGTGSQTYTLQPLGITNATGIFNGLPAQTYTIVATDANACTKSTIITITQPSLLNWTSVTQTNVSCNGGSNATITALASGGTGSISYTLQPGAITNSSGVYNSLTAQSYTITATDANGCTKSTTVLITQPTLLAWSSVNKTNVSCNGGSNATITALANGGAGILSYTLQPGSLTNTSGSFTALTAQNYTITVSDVNGCTQSTNVVITQPTPLLITNISNTIPSCIPGNDATLTVTGSGGTTNYQYSVGGPNQASNVFPNLGAATYTVSITDANGCTVTSVYSIIAPNAPVFTNVSSNNVLCSGGNTGSIQVSTTGGTGVITYNLQPGAINNTTGNFTALTANTYTVKATDNNGCSVSTIIAITQPSLLNWTSVTQTNVSCNGGSNATITALASGGTGSISYTLQPGAITNSSGVYNSLTAQSYTITATDANGCTKSTTVLITQPTLLAWSSVNKTNVSCNGGSNATITALANGGAGILSYTLQPGSLTNTSGSFTALTAQNYTITVSDVNGCTQSTNVVITQPTPLLINNISNTIPSCIPGNDATLSITGSGGTTNYQYSVGGPNQAVNVFPNLGAAIYTISLTDANGCTVTSVYSIIAPNAPVFTNVSSNNVLCSGGNTGSIQVSTTGGTGVITYNLQPGAINNTTGNFTALTANTYTVKATDNNGCSVSTIITITQPSLLNWTSVTQTNVSCNGGGNGSITALASGGTGSISYTLQPGAISNSSGIYNSLTAQSYTITATDANGCTKSTSVLITQPILLAWSSVNKTNVSCNGGSNATITALATGGAGTLSYTLQPGSLTNTTGNFTALTAQNYTITVSDVNGCTQSTNVVITQPTPLLINNISNTIPSCIPGNDATLSITGSGGTTNYQYSVGGPNQPANVFPNLGAATYTVSISDANGCTVTSVYSIIAPNAPVFTNVTGNNVLCNGGNTGSIQVSTTGGTGVITYNLQPGAINNTTGNFTALTANTYTVKATDNNGCSVSTIIAITQPSLLNWTSVTQTNVFCNGGNNATITALASGGTGSISYTLQPGAISNSSGVYNSLTAQSYTITATDANGCTKSTSVLITQPILLAWSSVNKTNVSCNGGSNGTITTLATGGAGTLSYTLQPVSLTNTSGNFTALTAQNYTITVSDVNGCTQSTTVLITQPTPLLINNISNTIPSCIPGNDATLTVTGSGGTTNYQYSVGGPNQSANVFPNLGAATYTVSITDANGCTVTSVYSIIAPNAPVFTNVSSNNVLCSGGNTGSIQVSTTGGTGVITYNLQPGAINNTTGNFTALTANTYTVKATDNNGCSVSTIIAITQPSPLNWTSVTQTNVSCNGGSNGSITALASGGTGSISYTLQPGAISNSSGVYNSLTAQSYTITATDANGCTQSTSVLITQPILLAWSSVNKTNVSCNGGTNATITALANGGTGTLNYTLQPGSVMNTSGSFTALTAQNYTITVSDVNGCTQSTTVLITQPTPLLINNISNTIPSCIPGNDATLTITGSGGTTNYQYSVGGPNQASNVFPNLGAATYTVSITDANGCTVSSVYSIIATNAPVITNIINTNASCIPGNDAMSTITAIGGTGSLSYSMNGSTFQSSNILSGLGNSTYTITVKDAIGCTNTSLINIITQASPTITAISLSSTSCNPGCDGTANITAIGPSSIFSYSLNTVVYQASSFFNSLCVNQYTVTVKDGNGCTATSLFTISTTNGPTLNVSNVTNVSCNGNNTGSISSLASGGTGLITYLLQPGAISNTTGIFSSLFANTYTITASDLNGCTAITTVPITQPPVLQFNNISSNGTLCSGSQNGSLDAPTIGGTGSITYSINPVATFVPPYTFSNLIGNTTYTITATDANNCSITTAIYISQANTIVFNTPTITNVTCNNANDGSINISANGGTGTLNYTLQPGALTNATGIFNGLAGNIFTITVTDANNCTLSTTLTVTEPPAIILSSLNVTDISCHNVNDGSIAINCTGGVGTLSYTLLPLSITNTSGNFNGLNAAVYTMIVTDATNCTYVTTATIVNPAPLVFSSVTQTNVLCFSDSNASISCVASGGTGSYIFSLNPLLMTNTNGLFNSLPAAIYTITVTDINGCSVATTVIITEPPVLNGNIISTQNVTCFGGNDGSCTVEALGGVSPYQYNLLPGTLSNTTGIFNNIVAGAYSVQIIDSNACTYTITPIDIIQPPPILWTSVIYQDISCYGDNNGTITVGALGGTGLISYSLTPATGSQITPGAFTGLTANSYSVVATDALGCSLQTIVSVNQNPQLIFQQLDLFKPTCHGDQNGSITCTGIGGATPLSYQLNGGIISSNGIFTGLPTGSYTVSVSDVLGCKKDSVVLLSEPDSIAAEIEITALSCAGIDNGKIIILATGGTGNLTYYLTPGLYINQTGEFTGLPDDTYHLTIKDTLGCSLDTDLVVTFSDGMSLQIDKKDLTCFGDGNEGWANAIVTGGDAPYSFLWSTTPPQTTAMANDLPYGLYFLEVRDNAGCEARDTVYIDPGDCCEQVFIPSAFTPNGDGKNDVFKVTTTAGIELEKLAVYDRWGNKVWNANDYRDSWNGTYQGKPVDTNTFYYVFQYICLHDKQKYLRKGDVTVIH